MFGTSPLELMAADAMLRGEIYCDGFATGAAWVTGTASALGATATVDQNIQIPSDADFILQEMNFTSTTAAGTFLAVPDYLLTLVIAGSGRQVQSMAMMIANICGSFNGGQVPSRMPFPRLIVQNSTVTATLANRTGTAANRAELVLRGFKVYYTGGNRQQIFHTA